MDEVGQNIAICRGEQINYLPMLKAKAIRRTTDLRTDSSGYFARTKCVLSFSYKASYSGKASFSHKRFSQKILLVLVFIIFSAFLSNKLDGSSTFESSECAAKRAAIVYKNGSNAYAAKCIDQSELRMHIENEYDKRESWPSAVAKPARQFGHAMQI